LHLGQLSGTNTVTAAIVAVNALIAEAWINRTQKTSLFPSSASSAPLRFVFNRYLSIAALLLVCLHLIGYTLYTRPLIQPPETALKVGIIQGNVPNEIKLYPEGFWRAMEGYTRGYKTLADRGVDAVLTPEGAFPFWWNEVMRTSFYSAVKEKGVVAWVGAFDRHGNSYTNSLFTLAGTGEVFSRYGKVKMVPIGEYVPFQEILGGIVNRLSPLDEHQVAGSPNQVFNTPFGRAIVVICYGSAFPELFRYQAAAGGQFILSPSNDAHFSPAMPAQHHAQDVMRAIETDRWEVRATNTGYSAIVDPHGRTQWLSRLNTYELHAATIYRRQTQTLYVRWGDRLTPLLLVLGVLAIAANQVKHRIN
jgi:apolipoprotein N-acyltransferase